jgi:hypothetical protein
MPDSNLNTSISAMRTAILNDLPTATVAELVDLSRAAKSLNLANDSTVETAINNRAVALINGGATQAEIIKISQAVKSVLSPATFANNIANFTTITSSLIPDTDVSYDLGTSSNRFNDIYLDGNTIDLGGQTIKSTATGIEVPEITIGSGTNKVKLSANSSGKLEQVGTNSGGVVQDTVTGSGPASTAVTNLSELTAISSPATGQSVLVTSTNKLYIYNGTGWYLIAEVTNLSPTAITGLNATYDLATDGTATTITLNSTDPEGATLTWSHAVTTGTLGSTATITNVDNVFTITPSTTQADAGSFSVTFSASDGSQAATSVSAFTLTFAADPNSVFFATGWGTVSGQAYAGVSETDGSQKTWSWTVPDGVTSIHVLCIGAGGAGGAVSNWGGGGGGGGALAWKNNITVTPGETLTVKSGWPTTSKMSGNKWGATGGAAEVLRSSTVLVKANGGSGGHYGSPGYYGTGGTVGVGDGGGAGGRGGDAGLSDGGGGGGAGGYTGAGGDGQRADGTGMTSGSGGGGGGGQRETSNSGTRGNVGGGTFPFGNNPSVSGVAGGSSTGSGGSNVPVEAGVAGSTFDPSDGSDQSPNRAYISIGTGLANSGTSVTALYNYPYGLNSGSWVTWLGEVVNGWHIPVAFGGGGGGLNDDVYDARGGFGGMGCVRIVWGAGRAWPGTNIRHQYNTDVEDPSVVP